MREHHAAGMAAAADAIPKVRVTSRQRLVMQQGMAAQARQKTCGRRLYTRWPGGIQAGGKCAALFMNES